MLRSVLSKIDVTRNRFIFSTFVYPFDEANAFAGFKFTYYDETCSTDPVISDVYDLVCTRMQA